MSPPEQQKVLGMPVSSFSRPSYLAVEFSLEQAKQSEASLFEDGLFATSALSTTVLAGISH